MKVTGFNKGNIKQVRALIDAELAAVSKRIGLDIKLGNITFLENSFSSKVEVSIPGAEDIGAKRFRERGTLYGFKDGDLGKEFTDRGIKYMIMGFKYKGLKVDVNKVLAKRLDNGKTYQFDASYVQYALGHITAERYHEIRTRGY
jgi:hypothetical protein